MLPRDSEGIERRQPSRLLACFQIEFRTDAPDEFRFAAYSGKHSRQEKQVARPYRLRINTERLGRGRKLDAKFLQSPLGAGRPRAPPGYHFPACKLPLAITWTATGTPAIGWSTRAVDTLTMLPLFCCNIRFTANCET